MIRRKGAGLIALLTQFFAVSTAFDPGYYDITQDFEIGAMNMLSLYLDDASKFNNVMDHGCHCARFDPLSNKRILGGRVSLDGLDRICSDWYAARQCLNKYDHGSCLELDNTNFSYQVAMTVDGAGIINGAFCNEINSQTSLPYNDCEIDSCKIDTYYVEQINEYLELNPFFSANKVTSGSVCDTNLLNLPEPDKYCAGEAPLVEIVAGIAPNTTTPAPTTTVNIVETYGSEAVGHLVFIIDRSSLNNVTQYQEGIDFIEAVVAPLAIDPLHTVVSLVGMSDVANIYVAEASSTSELDASLAVVRNDQATVPDRDIPGAVELAAQLLGFRNRRRRRRSVLANTDSTIVVITGGPSSTSSNTTDPNTGLTTSIYEEIQKENVTMIAVVTDESAVTEDEIHQIASVPTMEFYVDTEADEPIEDQLAVITESVTQVYVQVSVEELVPTPDPTDPPTTTMGATVATTTLAAQAIVTTTVNPTPAVQATQSYELTTTMVTNNPVPTARNLVITTTEVTTQDPRDLTASLPSY